MKTLIQRQFENEELAIAMGVHNYVTAQIKAEKRGDKASLAPENMLLREGILKTSLSIKKGTVSPRGNDTYRMMRSIVLAAGCDVVAFITLQTCLNLTSSKPLVSISRKVAKNIIMHLDYMVFKKAMPGYVKAIEKTMDSESTGYKINVLRNHMGKKGVPTWPTLSGKDAVQLGTFCIYRMLDSVDLFEMYLQRQGKNAARWIKLNPLAVDWIEEGHQRCTEISAQFLPMLVKPQRWESMYSGGFLNCAGQYKIPAVRSRSRDIASLDRETDMSIPYATLNTLQETSFVINAKVLEVMKVCREHDLAGLPSSDVKLNLPEVFWETDAEFKELSKTSPEKIKRWKMECAMAYDAFHRAKSKRQTLYWQIWTADKFKDEEEIYFAWNMDWRGRKYPLQPYLNPQTDKFGKSLLLFKNGEPLGEHGAYWLAIHGANVFGKDHDRMEERIQWIKDNSDLIVDSARNPLDGQKFWMKGDSPFECLAFAFAWAEYVEQGDSYVCNLPVSVDGSCSGLQHYSALLRDEIGGKYTNLIPQDSPSDIYMKVAETSTGIVAKDTENPLAELWHGKIERWVVKPNAMTYAYAVTLRGMADQVREEVEKRGRKEGTPYLDEVKLIQKASTYLANVNNAAIAQTVVKAAEGMAWFKDVAEVVTKAGYSLKWKTPSGMLIKHTYFKTTLTDVNTFHGNTRIRVKVGEDTTVPNPGKNKAAIAPNFTHGNDAAHVDFTVRGCAKEGITSLVFIHDSFGCNAGSMQRMNEILRETFIEMYSVDILAHFMVQLKAQLPADIFEQLPAPPKMGKLDLSQVKNSVYFFA